MHRDDDARPEPSRDLGGLRGADRRPVADGHEEDVDGAKGGGLLGAQLALAEVAEVRDALAAEREREQRVASTPAMSGYSQRRP
jgi:hypothetical protein